MCRVGELDLGVLSPLADVAPNFLQEELLRVQAVQEMDPPAVLDGLKSTAESVARRSMSTATISTSKRAVAARRCCSRTPRLRGDSCGSAGRPTVPRPYYTHDEADLYWSLPDLADTIIELDRRFGSGAVDMIGHSLGARGVVLALAEVANRHPDIRLGHVVLLAPDMDFGIFGRILPRIAPIAGSITVYATTGDRPLALSAQLHGYPRLGEAGNDVSGLTGVEVIDLSDLPSEGPTGHLYHIYSPTVGADLRQLLHEAKRAAARSGIVAKGENLWSLKPAQKD
jgi:pimeloyl-ACP methyl ester carboxylesterase